MSNNPQIKEPFVPLLTTNHRRDLDPVLEDRLTVNESYRKRKTRFEAVLARVTLPNGWKIKLVRDDKSLVANSRFYLCVHADDDVDVRTGERGYAWDGRCWYLEEDMTDSQIFRTAYLAAKGAVEHEFNESFLIDGARPFDPHIDLVKQAKFAAVATNADQP